MKLLALLRVTTFGTFVSEFSPPNPKKGAGRKYLTLPITPYLNAFKELRDSLLGLLVSRITVSRQPGETFSWARFNRFVCCSEHY